MIRLRIGVIKSQWDISPLRLYIDEDMSSGNLISKLISKRLQIPQNEAAADKGEQTNRTPL